MLQVGVELVYPLLVDTQKHKRVRVPFLIIQTLKLFHVYRVTTTIYSEYASSLRMNGTDVDCLLHALERHTKEENACYFKINRKIDKDLA